MGEEPDAAAVRLPDAAARPLRIALLTHSTRPRGEVVHTLALAESLVAAGQRVDVWSLAPHIGRGFFRPVDPRVTVRLVRFEDRPAEPVGVRALRSIDALANEFSAIAPAYDVIHAQDCISANAVPGSLRTIHHLETFTTPALAACHERAILDPVGHICVSTAVAAEVQAGWGIRPLVIPNGVEASRFAEAASSAPWAAVQRISWRERLGDYVLAVGRIEPRKGTADLVEGMAIVQRQRPDLRLVVAGGPTHYDYRHYREDVMARAKALGVVLEVLDDVDHRALPSLVAAATVFASPTVKESFGQTAFEAMAAGVPVVMRDLPTLRETFGEAAQFVRSGESFAGAILAAARSAALTELSAGRALARRFTWTAAATGHLTAYRALKPDPLVLPREPIIGATMS